MAWAIKVTIHAHEMHRPLGANDDVVRRSYSFDPPLVRADDLAKAWAKMDEEVVAYLLERLEPAKVVA